ncbi:MAG TPA: hypothetical protein VGM42_02365, partial [Rhodopila sp.]
MQIQPIWGRCGSTILFENQVENLVRAGFLTIRVFTDGQVRHGATLWSRLDHIIPENSTRAGAHIDVLALPDGAPFRPQTTDIGTVWRNTLTATAAIRMRDRTLAQAAAKAECVIANRLEGLGPALTLAPNARLLLALQEDRGEIIHQSSISRGRDEAAATLFAATASHVQAHLLAMADICGFASHAETARLASHCRRAVTNPPDAAAAPVPEDAIARFDLLLTAAEDAMNVAS